MREKRFELKWRRNIPPELNEPNENELSIPLLLLFICWENKENWSFELVGVGEPRFSQLPKLIGEVKSVPTALISEVALPLNPKF